MSKSGIRLAAALLAVVALSVTFLMPAEARPWKPSPQALAQDYLQIQHVRPNGEIILVFWFAPPMAGDQKQVRGILDKYIIVSVVHGRAGPGGAVLFDEIPTLEAKDGSGNPLKLVANQDLPPDVAQGVEMISNTMKQTIGATGQGMRFFVFQGDVHACSPGKLVIPYAGEEYSYDAPVPGCAAK
jgi:hypothetical protein